jgi:hypothetical protein
MKDPFITCLILPQAAFASQRSGTGRQLVGGLASGATKG